MVSLVTPAQLAKLSTPDKQDLLKVLAELEEAKQVEAARATMGGYTDYMWPGFIKGRHHKIMDEAFDRIISGDLKRLIINMGPRHTKSEKASWLLPSKFLGHYPEKKIIQTSHTAEFATGFGRKVRNTVAQADYQKVFPGTNLRADSKAAGRWQTSEGGDYFAIGVGGAVAGKGADLLIIDDPHSEQDYIAATGGDASSFDKVFEWYQTGPRQRLQPGAAIVIVMTRWHMRDLTGQLIKRMATGDKEKWELIEFPALMPETDKPLWPEFWSYEELSATRAELSPQQWSAQYLQNPTSEAGALVKREWWQIWHKREPPECEFIIQTWDTAYTKKAQADYSACTTWGIFSLPDEDTGLPKANIILLDAYRERMEFPTLKVRAMEKYKEYEPDAFIIEAKASGLPLIFELRAMGIPVSDFTPVRGTRSNPNDKIARVNAITDLFASGVVWAPDTRWAEDVVEEFAAFPSGDHDDYVDSGTIALTRYRTGGFIRLDTDEEDKPIHRKTAAYY
jgi:predicted phage terminase large subunit-like protein